MTRPNAELAYKVLDHIDAHPEQWDQDEWCGTAQCFAGWTVALSIGNPDFDNIIDGVHIADRAAELLGFASNGAMDEYAAAKLQLDEGDADEYGDPIDNYELFAAGNSRRELGDMVAEIFGPRPEADR